MVDFLYVAWDIYRNILFGLVMQVLPNARVASYPEINSHAGHLIVSIHTLSNASLVSVMPNAHDGGEKNSIKTNTETELVCIDKSNQEDVDLVQVLFDHKSSIRLMIHVYN